MYVSSINIQNNYQTNKQTNKNRTLTGKPHKSFYRYLDVICPKTAPADELAVKQEIINKMETFMAPLHKDTTFSVENVPAVANYLVPFPDLSGSHIMRIPCDVGDYQTFFSNKKTKSSFSLSEHFIFINDKNSKSGPPPEECIWKFWQEDKLSAFKSHVDAVIKFFDKDRGYNVDNVLYNNRVRKRRINDKYLPNFIVKPRVEKDKKLAPEFQRHFSNEDVYISQFDAPSCKTINDCNNLIGAV